MHIVEFHRFQAAVLQRRFINFQERFFSEMPNSKVCVLSDIEVKLWQDDRIHPNCSDHRHVSKSTATAWVNGFENEGRYEPKAVTVGGRHITLINKKVWSVLPSGDMRAYQFIPDSHGHRGDYRNGIGACGAKDMQARMSVKKINEKGRDANN